MCSLLARIIRTLTSSLLTIVSFITPTKTVFLLGRFIAIYAVIAFYMPTMARALEYTPATAQSQDYTPTTAQSWEYSQQAISSYTSEPIQSYAVSQARNAGINGKLILAILWTESRNCSITEGPTNDMGCFQISPHYAKAKGLNPAKLKTNSRYNTDAAIELLKYLKLRYGRKEPKTWFCRYNVGTGPMTGNKAKNCIKYLNALHYKTN